MARPKGPRPVEHPWPVRPDIRHPLERLARNLDCLGSGRKSVDGHCPQCRRPFACDVLPKHAVIHVTRHWRRYVDGRRPFGWTWKNKEAQA